MELKPSRIAHKMEEGWDFPGGPVGKTPCSQCRGLGFDPWLGNYIPYYAATKSSRASTKKPACHN